MHKKERESEDKEFPLLLYIPPILKIYTVSRIVYLRALFKNVAFSTDYRNKGRCRYILSEIHLFLMKKQISNISLRHRESYRFMFRKHSLCIFYFKIHLMCWFNILRCKIVIGLNNFVYINTIKNAVAQWCRSGVVIQTRVE